MMANEDKTPEAEVGSDEWLREFMNSNTEHEEAPESKYEELAEEYEDDPVKKMSRSMDEMQKKFDEMTMKSRIERFMDTATDNQKMLFKAVSGDIKDVKTLDRMMALAKEKGAAMDEEMKKVQDEMEKKRTASIWSMPGSSPKLSSDDEADIDERIRKGDSRAALHKMFDGDKILGGLF